MAETSNEVRTFEDFLCRVKERRELGLPCYPASLCIVSPAKGAVAVQPAESDQDAERVFRLAISLQQKDIPLTVCWPDVVPLTEESVQVVDAKGGVAQLQRYAEAGKGALQRIALTDAEGIEQLSIRVDAPPGFYEGIMARLLAGNRGALYLTPKP